MSKEDENAKREYWCFISYRHIDNQEEGRQWATWLHQSLETYEVPDDLVGTANERGETIPARIFPVFRDEEELATGDLTQRINSALSRTKVLVVLCSPRTIESKHVYEEIRYFKEKMSPDAIHAAVIEGDPGATTGQGDLCFPPPLRYDLGQDGTPDSNRPREPLAADFRLPDGSHGWTSPEAYRQVLEESNVLPKHEIDEQVAAYQSRLENSKLQLIAGILGVSFGKLKERDKLYQLEVSKKRAKTLRHWLTAVSVLALLAIVAAWYAIVQQGIAERNRRDARRQQIEAEKRLATSYIENGRDEVYDGNYDKALAWFAAAYHAAPTVEHEPLATAARDLIGSWAPFVGCRLLHGDSVYTAAMSPDGNFAITGGHNSTARLWDAQTGTPLHKLRTNGDVVAADFSPEGDFAFTITRNGAAEIWSVATGKSLYRKEHDKSEQYLAKSADDKLLVTSKGNQAWIWAFDGVDADGVLLRHEDDVVCAAISVESGIVVTHSRSIKDKERRNLNVWDAKTGSRLHGPIPMTYSISVIAFSPVGDKFVTAGGENASRGWAQLWDWASGEPGARLRHEQPVTAVAFSLDGNLLATGTGVQAFDVNDIKPGFVRVWNARNDHEISVAFKQQTQHAVRAVAFSPNGATVATGSGSIHANPSEARLWDVATGTPRGTALKHGNSVDTVAFSSDGSQIITGSSVSAAPEPLLTVGLF